MGGRCVATPSVQAAGSAIPANKDETGEGAAPPDQILRAKYFDWCSARIAERFVSLSTLDIYALADSAGSDAGDRSFQEVMDRALTALAAQTELPAFEAWAAMYRVDPESYDADMIGFWREKS
ncbi:MAG: hypothetical protein ABIV28_06140 [Longimicrobiales bacterium]